MMHVHFPDSLQVNSIMNTLKVLTLATKSFYRRVNDSGAQSSITINTKWRNISASSFGN
jgi:hypothetical protein